MSRKLTVTIPEQTFTIDLEKYDEDIMAGMSNSEIRDYVERPGDIDDDDLFNYVLEEIKANMNYDFIKYRVDGEIEPNIDEDLDEEEDINKELLNEYHKNLL